MTARWDIAAVVVALLAILAQVISVSPEASNMFHRTFRRLLCLIWPQGGQCRRLLWNDIPPGLLHQCNPPALCHHHISQLSTFKHSPNCWDETLGQVFTEAWKALQRNSKSSKFLVRKPDELPFTQEYIQIDIKTLKAFLMNSMTLCHTFETEDMMTLLGVKMFGGIITIHLKAPAGASIPRNHALSKFEVDRFIEGYPPFYRQSIETTAGIKSGPPIVDSGGIGRGSWILAVGMSTSLGKFCVLHNMQRTSQEEQGAYWRQTLVPTEFEMIRRNLCLIEAYEEKRNELYAQNWLNTNDGNRGWSHRALECCRLIMSKEYSDLPWPLKSQQIEATSIFEGIIGNCPCKYSCIGSNPHAETCGLDLYSRKQPAKRLNEKECKAALELFDNYRLSDHNLEIFMPKLPQILQTLIIGMSEVERYFSFPGRKLELPKELMEQKYVYLRKCAGDTE